MRTGVFMGALLIPVQIVLGDFHGLNTLKYQPQKIAAIEAIWETEQPVALRIFAIPDAETRSNLYEIAIPHLGSLILTHTWAGGVKGLNEFPGAHPPVAPVFFAFRIMVGMGLLMLAASWWAVWSLRRGGPTVWVARVLAATSTRSLTMTQPPDSAWNGARESASSQRSRPAIPWPRRWTAPRGPRARST
jgi:cytochrome d ubiquinol oxidase subunit I